MHRELAFYPKSLLSVLGSKAIAGKIAFGETEIMNGVEEVGFTYTIASANAHNIFGKTKLLVIIIFKLENVYGVYKKAQKKGLRTKIQGTN